MDDSDTSLIARTQNGDHQAFAELVRRYQAVSFRVAYVVIGSADEAEDATQEGFIRAFRSIDRFRLDASFRPWLLKIVANAARTRRSRSARRYLVPLADVDVGAIPEDSRQSPEAIAMAEERLSELLAAVVRLRHEDQQVIALRYFLELSEPEMATVLNCARGTVKSRLSRALERLRNVVDLTAEEARYD